MSFKELTGISSDVESWDRDEQEIRALTIVLDLERDLEISHEEALLATAAAIRDYFLDDAVREGGAWHEATKLWMDGRIRKLAKRARGKEFTAAAELMPNSIGSYADAVVLVFPPMLVTDMPKELKRLQVQGLDLPSRPVDSDERAEILVALNPDVKMTTGKTMAQVGHAVQLAIMGASSEKLSHWENHRPVITFVDFDSRESWDVEVHDAGFTEVEANSLTVRAQVI